MLGAAILLAVLLPGRSMANMNGAHFEGLAELVIGVLVVFALNVLLSVANLFWKNLAVRVINIIVMLPFAVLSLYLAGAMGGYGIIPFLVLIAQCVMIFKSSLPRAASQPTDSEL